MALVEERVNNLLLIRQRIAKANADTPEAVKTVLMGGNLKPKIMAQAIIVPPKIPEGFDRSKFFLQTVILFIYLDCGVKAFEYLRFIGGDFLFYLKPLGFSSL